MSPSTPLLTPETLDREAAALYESAAWQRIVTDLTAPAAPAPADESWRDLLSEPVERLVADALDALPPPLPSEGRIPGGVGAVLPDRL
ncbi:hypothetical protein ACFV6U_40030, partial [Streptomyces sp. NPDC059810]